MPIFKPTWRGGWPESIIWNGYFAIKSGFHAGVRCSFDQKISFLQASMCFVEPVVGAERIDHLPELFGEDHS